VALKGDALAELPHGDRQMAARRTQLFACRLASLLGGLVVPSSCSNFAELVTQLRARLWPSSSVRRLNGAELRVPRRYQRRGLRFIKAALIRKIAAEGMNSGDCQRDSDTPWAVCRLATCCCMRVVLCLPRALCCADGGRDPTPQLVHFCVREAVPNNASAVTLLEWRAAMTRCDMLGSNVGRWPTLLRICWT